MDSFDEPAILLLSLKVAVFSICINLFPAFFFAYMISRKKFWGKYVLEGFLILPLVLPPVVSGYFLLTLFSRQNAFGAFLERIGCSPNFNWVGAALAASLVSFPALSCH
jgi:molybdate transport system permease protein